MMKKIYKGIIFDLDGVICSTDEYHFLAWKNLAEELKIPFDQTVNHRLRGVSRMESLDILLGAQKDCFGWKEKLQLAEKKNRMYVGYLQRMTAADLSESVRKMLNVLKTRGFLLAIGSSSKNAGLILEHLGLTGFFDAVADGTMISKSKPDPEVFLLAARLLELMPKDCLVAEDAKAGLEAAQAGGFDSVAVGDSVSEEKANVHIISIDELSELL